MPVYQGFIYFVSLMLPGVKSMHLSRFFLKENTMGFLWVDEAAIILGILEVFPLLYRFTNPRYTPVSKGSVGNRNCYHFRSITQYIIYFIGNFSIGHDLQGCIGTPGIGIIPF